MTIVPYQIERAQDSEPLVLSRLYKSKLHSVLRGKKRTRRSQGSSLAEFAPALFLLFFFALFPAIDLIGIGLSYLSCISLNDLQLREACKVPRTQAIDPNGVVALTVPTNWKQSLAGGIGSLVEQPTTQVTYEPFKGVVYVTVSTTFVIHPTLTIPMFPGVPGLGAPYSTTITHSRVLENARFAVE